VAAVAMVVVAAHAAGPTTTPEAIWKSRAELAKRRLAAGGLDACDRGLEQGFQAVKGSTAEGKSTYPLDIEVKGKKLLVTYSYTGNQLDAFAIIAIPSSWVAYQKADSKTLRFVAGEANCAISLCTNGPTTDGPCVEKGTP